MFWFQWLSASASPTRFVPSSGETAGGGGCRQHAVAQSEDQALFLQQPAGLRVPLLLPPGYNLGQYTQVGFENTHVGRSSNSCRVVVVGASGIKDQSLDNVYVCTAFITRDHFCSAVRQQVTVWAARCPDAGGLLPVALVPTPMIKPAATSACRGELSSFSAFFSFKVSPSSGPHKVTA